MANTRKLTTEEIIIRFRETHGNEYNYSLVEYTGLKVPVTIICNKHGPFKQRPDNHIYRENRCPQCALNMAAKKRANTKAAFLSRAVKAHGNQYDYSKSNYVGADKPIVIICKDHGEFEQRPVSHWNGHGCEECAQQRRIKSRTLSRNEFVLRATAAHNDLYDYSKANYIKSTEKIVIICKEHGEFKQRPASHIRGSGCPKCARKRTVAGKKSNTLEFIKSAKKIHGDFYDYSKVKYNKAIEPIVIVCSRHGEFKQMPNTHLNGSGCQKCADMRVANFHSLGTEEFVRRAQDIFGMQYDYSLVKYTNGKELVDIICPEHGVFSITAGNHIHAQSGCPQCVRDFNGENKIESFLNNQDINHDRHVRFSECRDKRPLEFDFYIPDLQVLIEYDGIQHHEPIDWFGGQEAFDSLQRRDRIKDKFAASNDYNLIRIPYTEFDNIEDILSQELFN
jgi:very-short-patch-repair endonuclease/ribosomal protein L36